MRRLAACLAALALLAAGCGGNQRSNDYVAAVNRAQDGFAAKIRRLNSRITPTSTPAQDRRTLDAYEQAARDTVTELRGVRPPDGLDALHRTLIGEIADYGTAVQRARPGIGSADPRRVLAAQQLLQTTAGSISARINATISAINDRLGK